MDSKPVIEKLGTIECDLVETTPVIWKGRLYRYEYFHEAHKLNATGQALSRFVDVATGEASPCFAPGHQLGSAYVENDMLYVYSPAMCGTSAIYCFWSDDMKNWQSKTVLDQPRWGVYNTSVCKGPDGYVMAIELGEPPEEVGVRFTMRFAISKDLLNWEVAPPDRVFSKDRYTACPAIRFLEGWYYMIYLEAFPGFKFNPHIVRSRDLVNWESSPLNPVLSFSDEDRRIANPRLTEAERQRIATAVNINNSDVDLCEFDGKTVIYYSWGSQRGIEHLAEAVYNGSLASFLKSWFPD